jgi:hypothetical protein
VWWWWVFACKKKDPPPPVEPPAVQAPAPPAGVDAVLRALSAHDGVPDCAALGALAPDPAAALGWIAEYTELPPVAPMRAARCLLVAHPAAAEPAVTRWMTDPRSEGYVRVVIDAWAEVPPRPRRAPRRRGAGRPPRRARAGLAAGGRRPRAARAGALSAGP